MPANDHFANATELTGLSDSESASTAEATRETGEPVHAYSGQGSVWYRWTAPRTGAAAIDMRIRSTTRTRRSTAARCSRASHSLGGGRKVKFRAVQGTTYRIAVDGSYGSRGPVQLALSVPPVARPTTTSRTRRS